MLKVRVRIENFRFLPESKAFKVNVSFFLPLRGGEIPVEMLSPEQFFGERLSSVWGKTEGEWRKNTMDFFAYSLEELREKVKETIKREILLLKKIVKENRKKIKEVKQMKNEEKVYLI